LDVEYCVQLVCLYPSNIRDALKAVSCIEFMRCIFCHRTQLENHSQLDSTNKTRNFLYYFSSHTFFREPSYLVENIFTVARRSFYIAKLLLYSFRAQYFRWAHWNDEANQFKSLSSKKMDYDHVWSSSKIFKKLLWNVK